MTNSTNVSKTRLYGSYGLQAIAGIMLLMGAANNLLHTQMAVEGAIGMGYKESSLTLLGVLCLISTILYLIPKTAVIGAIMLTAWLGGTVATHIIHQDSVAMTMAPVVFAVIVWASLSLRHERINSIIPFVK